MALSGGCDNDEPVTLVGTPMSVVVNEYSLATVLHMDGTPLLAYVRSSRRIENAQATALIQSEIADGDNESIELRGRYGDERTFVIESLTANGYTIDF